MAKESFIKGTLILAAAALIARVLGVVQRVPLEHMLGVSGGAAFGLASNVYLMLLTFATAGIPSTLGKMVSEKYALNRPQEAQRIYFAAILFGLGMGGLITALLYIFAPVYAKMSSVPEATLAIRALAPALILFPVIAMMRGYFQGRNQMAPGGISQIIEQILRVITAVGLAYLFLTWGYSEEKMAAGASFGGVLGSIGAFLVMLYYARKLKKADREAGLARNGQDKSVIMPLRQIYKDIFKLSIPIVITSLAVPIIYFIDSSIIVPILKGQIGEPLAKEALKVLTMNAQSIAGIPPILAIALSTSIIPIISSAFARKEMDHLNKQVTLALRIAILSGTPIVLILCTAAFSVNGLLFSSTNGSGIISLLTFCTIFQIVMMVSGSILFGLGRPKTPMFHVMIGIAVKLAGSFTLGYIFGIYGIVGSTMLCFAVTMYLNQRSLKQIVDFKILGSRWAGFLTTVIALAGIGYLIEWAGNQLTHVMHARIAYFISSSLVGLVLIVLYPVMLVVFRVVTQQELSSYPRPLRKVFQPLMRLQRGQAVQSSDS
ncbi:polysaccharide biosynthesis protein [Paenibacillus terrigena]|uniref:putative polysaccharide biosynthesis protein n=1 Tax=Paenibacillus terrigena TaxID=369333 RepID=UPI0028D3E3B1|nr:polysaccharide biosynthesis protein [Paenibacillus terrigena]